MIWIRLSHLILLDITEKYTQEVVKLKEEQIKEKEKLEDELNKERYYFLSIKRKYIFPINYTLLIREKPYIYYVLT
jgi:hypothetical protein